MNTVPDLPGTPLAAGGTQRFEVDGADLAAGFLAGSSEFSSDAQAQAIHGRYRGCGWSTR